MNGRRTLALAQSVCDVINKGEEVALFVGKDGAVEVAPIVRCKNCEYWNRTPENTTSFWKPCDEIKTEPNWHCWCGTPRKAQEESGGNRK